LSTRPGTGSCWPQAVFPFYPPAQLEADEKLSFNICVYDQKLYICPSNLPPVNDLKIRVLKPSDLIFMNNKKIEEFFHASIALYNPTDVVDYTELLIPRTKGCDFRYLCLRNDLVTVTGESLCSRQEECEAKFRGKVLAINCWVIVLRAEQIGAQTSQRKSTL
jgi:hypothetical protein